MTRSLFAAVAQRVVSRMGVSVSTTTNVNAIPSLATLGLKVQGICVRGFGDAAGLSKEEVTERVLSVVKNMDKVDEGKVAATSDFTKDLGLDSLDTVEVVMAFEEEFQLEIPDDDADKITSCAQAIEYISNHPMSK